MAAAASDVVDVSFTENADADDDGRSGAGRCGPVRWRPSRISLISCIGSGFGGDMRTDVREFDAELDGWMVFSSGWSSEWGTCEG